MAILVIFTGRGLTAQMYDALRVEVNWEKNHPAGGIFHAAGIDQEGDLHVADVWDLQAALDAFLAGRLLPAFQKLNIAPPEAQVFSLRNATIYTAASRYAV